MDMLNEIEKRIKLTNKDKFAIGMILADLAKDKEGFEHFKRRYLAQ